MKHLTVLFAVAATVALSAPTSAPAADSVNPRIDTRSTFDTGAELGVVDETVECVNPLLELLDSGIALTQETIDTLNQEVPCEGGDDWLDEVWGFGVALMCPGHYLLEEARAPEDFVCSEIETYLHVSNPFCIAY